MTGTGDSERPDLRPIAAARQRQNGSASPRAAQAVCGMVALLAVAIVYLVIVSNQVSTGRAQLGTIATKLVGSEQQAATLKPYADFVTATAARRDAVAAVARTRFKWDRTLTELARVAPDGVWLTSVTGTIPAAAAPAPAVAAPAASGAGATPAATPAAAPVAQPSPTIALVGCASREHGVPAYIDKLGLMSGVTQVGFTRSERLDKTGASAAGGTGGGDCRGGDLKAAQFELTTYFKPRPALQVPATAPGQTGAAAAAAVVASPTAPATQTAAANTGGSR
jgi:Tfp pilus assembly protein PilN